MQIEKIPSRLLQSIGFSPVLKKLIHVGANTGQEVNAYELAGISGYHVEAHPDYFLEVKAKCDATRMQKAVSACCDAVSGRVVEFNVTSNKVSSSMLPLGRHATAYPTITVTEKISLTTTSIDDLVASGQLPANVDFLLVDVQGAEANVLSGAKGLLSSERLWGLQVETALDSLYDGEVPFEDLYKNHLKPFGFFLKSAEFNRHGWTEALFLKRWWRLPDEETPPLMSYPGATLPWEIKEGSGVVSIGPEGQCSQSSLSIWSTGPDEAQRAVSEMPNGGFSFHTNAEENAWWMIKWDQPRCIDEIFCFNRLYGNDETRNRIVGAVFEYSTDLKEWTAFHTVRMAFGGNDQRPLHLSPRLFGVRAIRVRQPMAKALHFDHIRFLNRTEAAP